MLFAALSPGVEGDLGRTEGYGVTMNLVHILAKVVSMVETELRLTQNTL